MSKLTLSVTKTEDIQPENTSTPSLTLSQKVIKEQPETQEVHSTVLSQTIQGDKVKITSTTSVEEITTWLLSFIGEGVFEQLKNNPLLQLPYTEPNITIKEWLEKALKTIFPMDYIKVIGEQIMQNQNNRGMLASEVQKIIDEKKALEEKLNTSDSRFDQFKEELEEMEEEKFRLKKELQTALPLSKMIDDFYREEAEESEQTKRLVALLKETLQNKDDFLPTFITRFTKGWIIVKSTLEQLKGEEKDKMEQMHSVLTVLLNYITGLYLPERRPLLDVVAKIVSTKFESYDFISPEQTLQIDPSIHNASGIGSGMISEGTTFAVIRKQTRQAVKYAEIKVAKP